MSEQVEKPFESAKNGAVDRKKPERKALSKNQDKQRTEVWAFWLIIGCLITHFLLVIVEIMAKDANLDVLSSFSDLLKFVISGLMGYLFAKQSSS